jgi:DoxX-like family
MSMALWTVQILSAGMFVLAGGRKLVSDEAHRHLGYKLAIFIGVAELAGAIGLIAPLATGVLPRLTVLAAVCLALVMVLAAGYHLRQGDGVRRTAPALVLLALTAFVAYGRW